MVFPTVQGDVVRIPDEMIRIEISITKNEAMVFAVGEDESYDITTDTAATMIKMLGDREAT